MIRVGISLGRYFATKAGEFHRSWNPGLINKIKRQFPEIKYHGTNGGKEWFNLRVGNNLIEIIGETPQEAAADARGALEFFNDKSVREKILKVAEFLEKGQ